MKTQTIRLFAVCLLGSCAIPVSAIDLSGTVRDFMASHPDFEGAIGAETGIVETTLGADGKPVYAGGAGTVTTTGAANFDQWYRDVGGVNMSKTHSITLAETFPGSGIYEYSSGAFFPIDGELLGNEGNSHNYHFTYEIHTTFTYQAGQTFSFSGDDDVWVFINNKLAVDLGGVHGAMSGSTDLDTLGLTAGTTYAFDFFFAERHLSESNFRIQTSIPLVSSGVPEAGSTVALLGLGVAGLSLIRRRLEN
jgi:fibro-slime domain-containing protein